MRHESCFTHRWPNRGGAMSHPESIHVAVVGCGHVGAVTAAGLARLGHRVVGIDIDEALVRDLCSGRARFREPGFEPLLAEQLAAGSLRFTTSWREGLAEAEIVLLCVNTPSTITGAADLRYVRNAVGQIADALATRSCEEVLLVNKSTAPIGTGETIEHILARSFASIGRPPTICANPEFLREGSAVADFFHPERIVIGADNSEDADRVAALYAGIDAPVVLTDLRSAEMIKYVSNAFLATRVSFINEIARLCESLDVNVDAVVQGVALDTRIGGAYFRP